MTDSLFDAPQELFDVVSTPPSLAPSDWLAELTAQVSQGAAALDSSGLDSSSLSSSGIDASLSGSFSTILAASPAPAPSPPLTATATPAPVMATFPRVPVPAEPAPVVMATFPPLPPASSSSSLTNSGVTRPREDESRNGSSSTENSREGGGGATTAVKQEGGGDTKTEQQQQQQQQETEAELEPWMETNPLLQWMSSPNRATRNLLHWDAARWRRRRPGAQRWLTDRMALVERYDMVAQVVCAMGDAEGVWASAEHRRPRADELHWPRLCDLERGDDGAVLVRPETLVAPRPRPRGSFAALMHDVLGKRGVSEPRDPGEAFGFLFNYAGADFGAADGAVREWRNDVGDTMTAPLAEVARALERERDVPPECTRAVLHLLADDAYSSSGSSGSSGSQQPQRQTVTLQGFCQSTRIFGRWWEGRMLAGLRELCAMGPCFYIATTRDAERRLRDTPQLAYIIRPRCKPDRGDDALWPFALTMRVGPAGTIEHYVVSFARGEFFVRDKDGTVMRRPSLHDLVHEFARSKCFR